MSISAVRLGSPPLETQSIVMISSYAKNAITLGLLAAIGPFAIDMYLPALPTIAPDLQASTAATQMTLMAFFVAFGLCQISYGPASHIARPTPPPHITPPPSPLPPITPPTH